MKFQIFNNKWLFFFIFHFLFLSQAAAAPSINLDPSNIKGGSPHFKTVFTEREKPVLLQALDANIILPDDEQLTGISVTINAPQMGDELSAEPSDTGIQVRFQDGTLELSGHSSLDNYKKVLRTIAYSNPSADPEAVEQRVQFTPYSDKGDGEPVRCTLTVVPVNNAPVHEYPKENIIPSDSYLIFSHAGGNPIHVLDQDARNGTLQLSLSVTSGTVSLPETDDVTIDSENEGSRLLVTGTLGRINTALNGLRYDPLPGWTGKERLSIETDDMGNTGIPGPQATQDTIPIIVTSPTVPPQTPVADAGGAREADEYQNVTLNGTGSFSPNGEIAIYEWQQLSGPIIELNQADTAMPSFTAPEYESDNFDIVLQLTVIDSAGKTATDTATVTIKPVDRIDGVFDEGKTVFLSGSENDAITAYEWMQLAGPSAPLSDASIRNPSFVAPIVEGDSSRLVFRLTTRMKDGSHENIEHFIRIQDNGIVGYPDGVLTFRPTNTTAMGIRVEEGDLVSLIGVDIDDTSPENRPINLIYGLVDLKIKPLKTGQCAGATFYLDAPAHEGFAWFKYEEIRGWYDYEDFTEFSSDRRQVRLLFKDGGTGDADGKANGVIHDPSGLGQAPQPVEGGSGDSGGSCFVNALIPQKHQADWNKLGRIAGKTNAVLVADADNNLIYTQNDQKPMMPASTLKLVTALMARHYLGPDHRFQTEFYTTPKKDLVIKGYGDPLLISEIVSEIAKTLAGKINAIHDILLDGSWFEQVSIPGVTSSLNPYDSPSGALCVNFNTVSFKKKGNAYVSAEPQTPLLPFILPRIKRSGLKQERIVLSSGNNEALLYAGHLFRFFLEKEGIRVSGEIRPGKVTPKNDRLIYKHLSPFSLDHVIERLMEYSNNYIANQLFITSGIQVYGPPGTLEKGRQAAAAYVSDVLKQKGIVMEEGSGISRKNRISARQLLEVLNLFEPQRHLLRNKGIEYYKTGSLTGVKSRAGFMVGKNGSLYRFVVLINTPGKTTDPVMRHLRRLLHP